METYKIIDGTNTEIACGLSKLDAARELLSYDGAEWWIEEDEDGSSLYWKSQKYTAMKTLFFSLGKGQEAEDEILEMVFVDGFNYDLEVEIEA